MGKPLKPHVRPSAPNPVVAGLTLIIFAVLVFFGTLRDFFGRLTGRTRYPVALLHKGNPPPTGKSLARAPLLREQDTFYTRRLFNRIRDCWDRPICSTPGSYINVIPRITTDGNKTRKVVDGFIGPTRSNRLDSEGNPIAKRCLNLGSYNYLGFADNWNKVCGKNVLSGLDEFGTVATSTPLEAGRTSVHRDLEEFVADFLHQEAALTFSMGYGTNATVLASLLGEGTVVVSDNLNHTSIVNGCRGAKNIKTVPFEHGDLHELETVLQRLILCGQSYPKLPAESESSTDNFTPWKKIVVVVEGIYSMEGECVELFEVNEICKRYKCFLYVDEAHSIGALGKTGRGICEYTKVDFSDVDLLMGTFSKSFGGMGGYVAGKKAIIDKLRANCAGQTNSSPLSTVIAQQVLTAFRIIKTPGGLGQQKIQQLQQNANYFRKKLKQIGLKVLGNKDSPVIPVMVYQPTKFAAFSRELLDRGVAVVVVGAPATSMYEGRVRFCLSAAHSREDLREAIKKIEIVSRILNIKYNKRILG